MKRPKAMLDLRWVEEDDRIRMIGQAVAQGLTVSVALERDQPDKIERYILKLADSYPDAVLLERSDLPTQGLVFLKYGPKPK